ncbi:MAG: hypothetical protein MJA27_31925 [Pseudanabaenales cyanobacterium]|nr:hypothetical protein [Pseudanabaenales cyanobacterium]
MPTQLNALRAKSIEHSPLYSQCYSLSSLDKVDDVLTAFGLQKYDILDSLLIGNNVQKNLSSDLEKHSSITPKIFITKNLDQYKSWIGRDDTGVEDTPWVLPTALWNDRKISVVNELTPEEVENVEKAGRVYIFGNSALVRSYREIIEFCNAPFEVAVYAARKVIIKPGGSLIVSGIPAILLFEELEIHSLGNLAIYTVCHAKIGTLQKIK